MERFAWLWGLVAWGAGPWLGGGGAVIAPVSIDFRTMKRCAAKAQIVGAAMAGILQQVSENDVRRFNMSEYVEKSIR